MDPRSFVRKYHDRTVKIPRCMLLSVFIGALAVPQLGCETISDDVSDLAGSFSAPSPSEAGRWMVDLYDDDKRRRGTVLILNSPFGNAPANMAWYRDRLQDEKDPLVLAALVAALGKHGTPEDAMLIAPKLKHDATHVRWQAARALQRLHNPAVVSDLVNVVRNEAEMVDVRDAAANALGQYPEDRVFQALLVALNDRDLSVNMTARQSLLTLTGRDFGEDSRVWLNWYNNTVDNTGGPFADRREYLYPTYERDLTWLEKLAFWAPKSFEQPAPPAGLRPSSARTTYEHDTPVSQ